jgi:hypothetical protein
MRDFLRALFACAEVFREPMSEERALAYSAILSNYDESVLVRAVRVWLRTGTRFPLPVQLIAIIEGDGVDVESEATAEFAHLADKNFDGATVKASCASNPCVAVAVAACGGAYLLRDGTEGFEWKRRSFVLGYKGARQREQRERALGELPPPSSGVRDMIEGVTKRLGRGKEKP